MGHAIVQLKLIHGPIEIWPLTNEIRSMVSTKFEYKHGRIYLHIHPLV